MFLNNFLKSPIDFYILFLTKVIDIWKKPHWAFSFFNQYCQEFSKQAFFANTSFQTSKNAIFQTCQHAIFHNFTLYNLWFSKSSPHKNMFSCFIYIQGQKNLLS